MCVINVTHPTPSSGSLLTTLSKADRSARDRVSEREREGKRERGKERERVGSPPITSHKGGPPTTRLEH